MNEAENGTSSTELPSTPVSAADGSVIPSGPDRPYQGLRVSAVVFQVAGVVGAVGILFAYAEYAPPLAILAAAAFYAAFYAAAKLIHLAIDVACDVRAVADSLTGNREPSQSSSEAAAGRS